MNGWMDGQTDRHGWIVKQICYCHLGIASSTSISPTELFDLLKADAKVNVLSSIDCSSSPI